MNKTTRIIIDIALIIAGIILLIFGIKDAVDKINALKVEDGVRFNRSYSYVEENNRYKYVDLKAATKLLKEKSDILLIGSPKDTWTQVLVKPLHDIVPDNLDIYYLEVEGLDEDTKAYKEFPINLKEVGTPIIVIANGGELEVFKKQDIYDEEYDGIPLDYFDEERVSSLKKLLKEISSLE